MNQTDTGCGNCGKQISDHKAGTHHCPGGRKHQTHGYPWFHWSQTFAEGSAGKIDPILRDQAHGKRMMGSLLELAMKPGLLDAMAAANERA